MTEAELFPDVAFAPIDAAAKNGRALLVKRGADYARAKWHVGTAKIGMWIYDVPDGLIEQIDFEPTHYAELRQ